jgi:RNA-binding protein 5/10
MKHSNSDSENSNDHCNSIKSSSSTISANPSTVTSSNVPTDDSLIDLKKMACLLCKRRFDSLDILNKHIAKSDLHKVK